MTNRWIFILFCFCCISVRADLKWESKTVRAEVLPVQLKTTVAFQFKNKGKTPVEILKINPSCACLAPRLAKKSFAPGETGVLTVVFNLEDRIGPQLKSLKVYTGENPAQPDILYIDVDIPEAFKLSAKQLLWNEGEERAPKLCRLTNVSGVPVSLKPVVPPQAGIKVETRTIKEGFEYDVVVDPDPGMQNTRAVIRIGTQCPSELKESKTFKIYVIIK
ncbi:MAG: DUF1573 domain-containing protein [Kiritimatiellales bacterium]|nr:DUF1573 domain-containing protein [Kiritimatiellales bacterium]